MSSISIRITAFQLAVVNLVRGGMWHAAGFDPIFRLIDAIDAPMGTVSGLGGAYSAVSLWSLVFSLVIVVGLGRKWAIPTVVLAVAAGALIGSGDQLGAFLLVPAILLGLFVPVNIKRQKPRRVGGGIWTGDED